MRKFYVVAIKMAVILAGAFAFTATSSAELLNGRASCEQCEDQGCCKSSWGRGRGCGRLHQHHLIEGRDPWFSCGCAGSYKFPVPPLYTYHWPGMYSMERMTDYRSPWRFPPLKPYADETIKPLGRAGTPVPANASPLLPVSARQAVPGAQDDVEPLSAKMQRLYR